MKTRTVFFIAVALSALGFVPIAAFAQGEIDVVQNTTALIIAFGGLAGAIGGIILSVVKFAESKGLIKEGDHEMYNKIVLGAEGLQETDRWVQEQSAKIATVVSVLSNLSPEAKKALEENGVGMAKLTADVKATEVELDRIQGIIPK